tara:strand:+ start:762 stop:1544 length:783 start_codon:yes stop_codon:yes gene_type:complete
MSQDSQEAVQEAPVEDKGLLANMRAEEAQAEEKTEEGIDHKEKEPVPERPEFVPEKFWNKDKGEVRLEDVFKSQGELEKKLSQGKHKAPEEYDYEILDKNGWTKDDPVVGKFTEWSKANNITQENFNELVTQVIEIAGQGEEQEKINSQKELEKLGNNGKAVIKQNLDWIEGKVNQGVFTREEADIMDGWGNTAMGIKLISKIKSLSGDLSPIPIVDDVEAKESDDDFTARMDSMMSDERYGNDMDFTRKVEKEFQLRYG